MPYPSYSYLDQDTLRAALDMAHMLQVASETIEELANGGGPGGRGDGGRIGDTWRVVQDWIGPTRDTFELLVDNERESAVATSHHLADEAEAWARFWATATNARNDRLYDEAVRSHEAAITSYRPQLVTTDGYGMDQGPPPPPVRSPPVSAPSTVLNYLPPPHH